MTTTPTKNESLPELPEPYTTVAGKGLYHWRQMHAYARAALTELQSEVEQLRLDLGHTQVLLAQRNDELEAALTREAPTEGDGEDITLCPQHGHMYARGCAYCACDIDALSATPPAPQRHPDALEDGSLSKSTAKRVDALRMAQGERPSNCRMALRDAGKAYPRSGCVVCGDGGLRGCPYERTTQPPHQDRGEVRSAVIAGLRECVVQGYAIESISEAADYVTAALTEAKQRGPGEARPRTWKHSLRVAIDALEVESSMRLEGGHDASAREMRRAITDLTTMLTAPQVEAKRQAGEGE